MNRDADIAITARSLGKAYRIGHLQSLVSGGEDAAGKQRLGRWRWPRLAPRQRLSSETFWALRDVDFDVPRGKVFGVIGRNGAGKSTLLKVLSRITEPTTGMAEIRGKVGSLLEVGTGFHPELSGRENIYLNGTLLGMRRRQIDRVFDAIVSFAEVERFIDTPVKRYSSGMYVRLAFAVAAHLEPDVLVIDEVLAVGDIEFQKRCLGKMRDVTGQGRTVLFVSHNLTSVNSLCDRCLLLEQGKVLREGPTEEVTQVYYGMIGERRADGSILSFSEGQEPGDEVAQLIGARLIDLDGCTIYSPGIDDEFGVEMTFRILRDGAPVIPLIHVFAEGQCAFMSMPSDVPTFDTGVHRAKMWLPKHLLNEGCYDLQVAGMTVNPQVVHFAVDQAIYFYVSENVHDPARHGYVHKLAGLVRPRLHWEIT
jgi:lipopolysaccharide transport system ATP-binding protein